MRSESDRISSSSSETSRIAAALVALVDEPAVEELDRADVEPARRLRGDRTRGSRSTSRATTTFCWLPPESAEACVWGVPPRTSNSRDQLARALDEPARAQPAEAGVRLVPVVVERQVLGEREVEDEAAALAVLGDVAEPSVERSRAPPS